MADTVERTQKSGRGFALPVYDEHDRVTLAFNATLDGPVVNAIVALSRQWGIGTAETLERLIVAGVHEHERP